MIIKFAAKIRNDAKGAGYFGAPRGSRTHNGQDHAMIAGADVLSPVRGFVTKLGYPYDPSRTSHIGLTYRYIEIETDDECKHRFFYVDPYSNIDLGDEVEIGDPIGVVQDIVKYHGEPMINHIHYEIYRYDSFAEKRIYIDPDEYHLED